MNLGNSKQIHFLGIGGIGISALARLLHAEGKEVSGQDTSDSPVVSELKKIGVSVKIGQALSQIPKDADLIIYSVAIPERMPKFMKGLKKLKIPILSYPEALGLVSKDKYTIAVAGTHGKTTTTAMIGQILTDAGLDPTIIVGSLLNHSKSNFVSGKSRYLVVEADDYRRAFLHLAPSLLVVTNIGLDHLDYYKDLSDIQLAFSELAAKTARNGYVVTDGELSRTLWQRTKAKVVDYREFYDKKLKLPIAGEHNRLNAAAALAVAHVLNIPKKITTKSLEHFSGTWRRFDFKGKTRSGALIYDDYAHNPEKVEAAIAGYREAFPHKRLTVLFQPHLYSRTKTLLKEFSSAFDGADEVVVVPIFAAREKRDDSISSRILVDEIKKHLASSAFAKPSVSFVPDLEVLSKKLKKELGSKDILVTMGAGDIYEYAEKLVKKQ